MKSAKALSLSSVGSSCCVFFFSSRRRHTRLVSDWSSDVCSSDLPPFLITATVEAILAQRLVRRICTQCRDETRPTTEMLADLGMTPADIVGKRRSEERRVGKECRCRWAQCQ